MHVRRYRCGIPLVAKYERERAQIRKPIFRFSTFPFSRNIITKFRNEICYKFNNRTRQIKRLGMDAANVVNCHASVI